MPAPAESSHQHIFVDSADGLPAIADALAAAPWVAVDTESNSMFVYREQVCLIQLNIAGQRFVIDPLALGVKSDETPSEALALLRPGFARTDRPLWVHGGEYDVAVMGRDFKIVLGGIFDTQQAASLLGHEKTGYGSLVEAFCDVKLSKAYATYDWATRPLDPKALAYAIDDIVYLPIIAEHLVRAVKEADIEDEVRIGNETVANQRWNSSFDPDRMWRVRDIDNAGPDSLRALARLYRWRDEAAAEDDIPPGRMVNDEILKWMARHRPTTMEAIAVSRLKPRILDRHGKSALAAIAAAVDDEVPVRPVSPVILRECFEREDRLKRWRREESETRSKVDGRPVPFQLVLPARALEYLKLHGGDDLEAVPQLGPARIARYGETLQKLCLG